MPRKISEPDTKPVYVRLFTEDLAFIEARAAETATPASALIRLLVKSAVERLKADQQPNPKRRIVT